MSATSEAVNVWLSLTAITGDIVRKTSLTTLLALVLAGCADEHTATVDSNVDSGQTDAPQADADVGEGCSWEGDLDLGDVAAVAAFNASGCVEVDGDVFLRGTELTEVPSVAVQRIVGPFHTLSIVDNPNLTSLAGLARLESAGTLFIGASDAWTLNPTGPPDGNPALTSLDGLSSLRSARLFVIGNAGLESLDGLDAFERAGTLHVAHNASLVDVSALHGVAVCGEESMVQVQDNGCLDPDAAAALDASVVRECAVGSSIERNGDACP